MEKWFLNALKRIMKHNNYPDDWVTVSKCDEVNKWTPVDLILREYYNNGGGSAKGFLGISTALCEKCYYYIRENAQEFIDADMVNKKGVNNSGFTLWDNYHIH